MFFIASMLLTGKKKLSKCVFKPLIWCRNIDSEFKCSMIQVAKSTGIKFLNMLTFE